MGTQGARGDSCLAAALRGWGHGGPVRTARRGPLAMTGAPVGHAQCPWGRRSLVPQGPSWSSAKADPCWGRAPGPAVTLCPPGLWSGAHLHGRLMGPLTWALRSWGCKGNQRQPGCRGGASAPGPRHCLSPSWARDLRGRLPTVAPAGSLILKLPGPTRESQPPNPTWEHMSLTPGGPGKPRPGSWN